VVRIVVYFDGLCEPVNPGGVATYGFVAYWDDGDGPLPLRRESGLVAVGCLGQDATNNVAEYTALIRALEFLAREGLTLADLSVRGDSMLVIRQLQGIYSVSSPRLIPLHARASALLSTFRRAELRWVPRELNAEADALSREAYLAFVRGNPDLFSRCYSGVARRRGRHARGWV